MRVLPTIFCAVLSLATSVASPAAESNAIWRPASAPGALETELRALDGAIDRGAVRFAAKELERIEGALGSDPAERFAFGTVAIRAALESGGLTNPDGRARVDERLVAIKKLCEDGAPLESRDADALDDAARAFALAFVRAEFALGDVANGSDAEEAERYLTTSFQLAKKMVQTLPNEPARPFVYWCGRATLARKNDPDRFDAAEKLAAALAKAARKELDERYFFARLLSVEIALEREDASGASKLISETLDALGKTTERPDALGEIGVALVAAELRALRLEGKTDDAVRLAASDVDLLGAPLPVDVGRFARTFYDVFSELALARAETFWSAIDAAPESDAEVGTSTVPTKKALTTEARRASSELRDAYWRARALALAIETGQTSEDWKTLEATAAESYRTGALDSALEGYDRAAESASSAGAEDDAFRLARATAAIVDKICRDGAFAETSEPDPDVWRASAQERFERLARTRPNDPDAPTFFQAAIEYAVALGRDAESLRFERLTLFPTAPDRGAFAVELARAALADGRPNDAARALDVVEPDDPAYGDSIDLERRLFEARTTGLAGEESTSALVATLVRALARARAFKSVPDSAPESFDALAEQLDGTVATSSASPGWAFFFELALGSESARSDERFVAALNGALDRWEKSFDGAESDASTLATIRSFRTSLAVATRSADDALRSLGDFSEGSPLAALDALERVVAFAERASDDSRRQLAQLALDALESLNGKFEGDARQSSRVALVRADALRALGKSQEALALYAAELKRSRQNVGAVRGIATLLSAQKDEKTLARALKYWSDVADLVEIGTPEWWDAKERCVELHCRLGESEKAEKMLRVLWLTRSDPTDPERKARWEKIVAESKKR